MMGRLVAEAREIIASIHPADKRKLPRAATQSKRQSRDLHGMCSRGTDLAVYGLQARAHVRSVAARLYETSPVGTDLTHQEPY